MTIDEAINENAYHLKSLKAGRDDKLFQAVRLGIEALKEVQYARQGSPALDGELLPGETEE